MNAIIMAGGKGTRLMPLTSNMPKPMANIAGKPCILRTVELLRQHGIYNIAVTVAYKKEIIKTALINEHLHFFDEEKPLGTAGSVKNCESFVDEDFIVISGDAVCDFDLSSIIKYHKLHGNLVTIVLTESNEPLEYGVCVTDESGIITRFIEKPSWECVYSNLINTGIYILSKKILDYIPKDTIYDFSNDLFPLLMSKHIEINSYTAKGYWCDIGNIKAYMQCNKDILHGLADIEIFSHNGCGAKIIEPCIIGNNVMAEGAVIGPFSIIGDNTVIGEDSIIDGSIIGNSNVIGESSKINNAIICDHVKIGLNARIYDYAVISDRCSLGDDVIVSCENKIYPDCEIKDGSLIRQNITHEINKTQFDKGSIDKPENISEYTKWGYAFGKIFEGNIGVACDDDISFAESLAIMSGILSSGSNVMNLGECEINSFKYSTRSYGFSGGIYITQKKIFFIEDDGLELSRFSERKVYRCFFDPQVIENKKGRYRILNHFLQIYEQKLKRYTINTPIVHVRLIAPDFISRLFNIHTNEKDEIIYISDKLTIPGYSDEQIKCAVCYAYGKIYGKVYIPVDFPHTAEEIAYKENFDIFRMTYDDKNRKYLYDMTDKNVMGCVLIKFLSINKISFKDLIKRLPVIFTCKADIAADRCKVMRTLSSSQNKEDEELISGVCFHDRDKKCYITVLPRRDYAGFRLITESVSSETANEMCDIYLKKIKKINSDTDLKKILTD